MPDLATTIVLSPDITTTSRAAVFGFTGSEGITSFECKLDAAAYAPCSSEQSYSGLNNGQHTFLVRGVDVVGNKGAPARHVWRVQNVAPVADNQSTSTGRDTAIDITLTAVDNEPITFELVDSPANGNAQLINTDCGPVHARYGQDRSG